MTRNPPRFSLPDGAPGFMARQLQNFKDDVRGGHLQDFHGKQMGFMADILHDEQAINDVIAYINTL
jgi:cytochrome c oxidase subunit 2